MQRLKWLSYLLFYWTLKHVTLTSQNSRKDVLTVICEGYKHMYGNFTKDEKEYQDTICSEAEEGNGDRPWEVLYDYIVDPATSQPSEETSGQGRIYLWKELSLRLFWSWWQLGNISFSPYRYYLCFTTIFATLLALSSVNEAVFVWAKTTVRTFSNFNLLHGRCTLLPFPSALTS